MIFHRQLDDLTQVIWAKPTSGFGHLADEQPLPYLHRNDLELTPRFGGEEATPVCSPKTAGLPYGVLDQAWPIRQRIFNFPRRPINLYWRNILRSRAESDGGFLFLNQLRFSAEKDGFTGASPILTFKRKFVLGGDSVRVEDVTTFRLPVKFSRFYPVVVPLFPEWGLDGNKAPWLDCSGFVLKPRGRQQSSAGNAVLWSEGLTNVGFAAGDKIERSYTYRLRGQG